MPKLKRALGLFETSIYGIGIILGAGIYALIGKATGLTGNSVWLSFLIGAVISAFTGLSYAEFSSIFTKAGGSSIYVKNTLNNNLMGFIVGWLMNIQNIFAAATVSLGFGGYLKGMFGLPVVLIALGLLLLLSCINCLGIEKSSKINTLFTLIEFSGLILIIFLGIGSFGNVDYLKMSNGLKGLFSASALTFFAYLGFEDIVQSSEETVDSHKNIPKAILLSIVVTSIIYMFVGISTVSLANWKELSASDAPLAYVASKVFGEKAYFLLSVIALFATANTALMMLVSGSRLLYGMAKAGSLPRILSKVHIKRRTPQVSILVTMVFAMAFCLLRDIKLVADVTNFGTFLTFAIVNFSLIYSRIKKPDLKRPFKVPLNIGEFPLLAFFGLGSCLFMLLHFEMLVVLISILMIALGLLFYKIFRIEYNMKKQNKKYMKLLKEGLE